MNAVPMLLLDRISALLCAAATPPEMIPALHLITEAFPGATLVIWEGEPTGGLEVKGAAGTGTALFEDQTLPVATSLAGWVWRTKEPLVSRNLILDPRAAEIESVCGGSGLLAPVLVSGNIHAVLAVYTRSEETDPPSALALLSAIARVMGVALERLHLRRSQDRQVRHMLALHEVSRMLASSLEDRVAMELAVDVAVSLFDLDLCAVLLRERDGRLRIQVSRGVIPEVAARIQLQGDSPPPASFLAEIGWPEVAFYPMMGRGSQVGYLVAGRRSAAVNPEEGQMLSIWTNLTGTALENSRLWQETVEKRGMLLQTLVESAVPEQRPDYTNRLSSLTGTVARRLGWNETEIRELEHLALVCYLIRIAHRSSHGATTASPHSFFPLLEQLPFRLAAAPSVLRCYRSSLMDQTPPLVSIPREAQVILAVEFFLSREYEEKAEPRENLLAALMSTKAQAGRWFDPAVEEALEAVVWARISITPFQMTARPPAAGGRKPATSAGQGSVSPATPSLVPVPRPEVARADQSQTKDNLTEREQEILQFVAKGLSNREIAAQLFLSEATVKTHVHRILHKLGLPDRTKAAVYLLQQRGGLA